MIGISCGVIFLISLLIAYCGYTKYRLNKEREKNEMKGDFSDVRQVSENFEEPRGSVSKVGRRRSSTKTPLD